MRDLEQKWNMQYVQLVEFKRKEGHCMVPRSYEHEQAKSLGEWVSTQRSIHTNDKLRFDRKKLLDDLGFVWKAKGPRNFNDKIINDKEQVWHQQHEKLVEFKRKSGHCRVPTRYEQDKSLGDWVSKQRRNHFNNTMRLDRKRLLDEVGFVWKVQGDRNIDINDKVWHQQYEKLVEFKRKKGHCLVPRRKYEQDRSLAKWVSHQRNHHKNNKLRLDRKKLLDEIEFVWKAVTGPARYSTRSSASLPNEGLIEESEQVQGDVRNRFECPSRNRKRPRTCLADSGEKANSTNPRGKRTSGNCSCVEDYVGGLEEEDSNTSLVTVSARTGSDPGQEVDQEEEEEATTLCEIPSGWARVKLEPDC
jgi:hypothetical protein